MAVRKKDAIRDQPNPVHVPDQETRIGTESIEENIIGIEVVKNVNQKEKDNAIGRNQWKDKRKSTKINSI